MTTSFAPLSDTLTGTAPMPKTEAGPAHLHHAYVHAIQGAACVIICDESIRVLPIAAGCLLQPSPGDRVLVSLSDHDGYVIQVLSRCAEIPARLHIQGDAELRANNGQLRLAADTLDVYGKTVSVRADRMIETGESRQSNWTTNVEIAHHQKSLFTRREMHIERGVRRVAEHEEQSAGSVRLVVERDWRVRAATADLLAERRVKVDADTVQLG